MVACCAHHVTDVLPILGLTAAATFLAKYRLAFMGVGLGTTILGIGFMLFILIRERRKVMQLNPTPLITKETL
jgi:ERCC4-related helicase